MVALYQISTNSVIQDWGNTIPSLIQIPGVVDVHSPTANWAFGDYKLIPVSVVSNPNNQFSVVTGFTKTLTNGTYYITTQYTDTSLANVQVMLCANVDSQAETIRLKYITPGSGQVGVYMLKYLEALDISANASPIANDFPLNNASVGLPGISTIQQAANTTLNQFGLWILVAAQIEEIRLSTKGNINAANSVNSALAAYNSLSWGSL